MIYKLILSKKGSGGRLIFVILYSRIARRSQTIAMAKYEEKAQRGPRSTVFLIILAVSLMIYSEKEKETTFTIYEALG